jgi:hypothetical protein
MDFSVRTSDKRELKEEDREDQCLLSEITCNSARAEDASATRNL